MSSFNIHSSYPDWLKEVKERIKTARLKVALAANSELIHFYWDLGRMIVEKQALAQWGDKIISQLAKDLQADFPDMRGLSERNIKYCRQFYQFYSGAIGQQPVAQIIDFRLTQIPWGHNILSFSKSENQQEAFFYIEQTIENGWSRDLLALQIKSNLFKRQGNAITNFQQTLPQPQSDLAQQTLKDPYIFDFLTMGNSYHEKDIENQLLGHITKFLLELGKGFAFVGKQYHVAVGEVDYNIDLLFYHVKLKCYVVLELKNTKLIPEYAGKLNFYLSAVDSLIKTETDNATIGILLCRDKNNFETEFALRDINKPMGVSEFQLTEILPEELKSSLPTIEEIEQELKSKEYSYARSWKRRIQTNGASKKTKHYGMREIQEKV
jgi:predicted nuclease of restriction endonuclease-like (RecB) superfamily